LPERFFGANVLIANEEISAGTNLLLGAFGTAVFYLPNA
jgi:hypothetical protein